MSETSSSPPNSDLSFNLLEFNSCRRMRGAAAARIWIEDSKNNEKYWLWMSKTDLIKNIKLHGKHPALVQALERYK